MNLTDAQVNNIRSALIAGREFYCADMCEHGGDGMQKPHPEIKTAMELMGLQWEGDIDEIFAIHPNPWTGNEHLKPHTNSRQ